MDLVLDVADYLKVQNERDYVLFMFGIYTGLRISDILKFRVRDVKDKDAVYIREEKTGKEKRFPINAELKPIIVNYIQGKRILNFCLNPQISQTRQSAASRHIIFFLKLGKHSESTAWERTHYEKHSAIICTNRHMTP